jgi:multidrug efflux pump subunit AcrA (membrane-fusion protein)
MAASGNGGHRSMPGTGYRPGFAAPAMGPRSAAPVPWTSARTVMAPPRSQTVPVREPHATSVISQDRRLRGRAWRARAAGVFIAGTCAVSAVWYVPRIIAADRSLLTGTVISTGVVTLNFASSGEISKIHVQLGQTVRKGQVLATEYAPEADSLISADKAAIAADQAKIAQLKAASPAPANQQAEIAAAQAQLAEDQAQLATDKLKLAETEIVAPSDGTVVALNGQPGETVSTAGVKDYAADSQQVSGTQRPEFSLLPEGPQSVKQNGKSQSDLPVVALRTSDSWQVVAFIPEASVSGMNSGTHVTIDVPAAHITAMAGTIEEVLPNPVSTTQGVVYQAVVTVTGHAPGLPLDGMAANVQLGS